MNREVKLFIDDQEVEFKEIPAILYNWQETDYTNPTVTMNSYSANITVEGTPQNNKIFGQYWNLERYTTPGSAGYNPTYRIPFTLYVDNSIYESGYVKLQKVTVSGDVTTYEISLFGGLGSFLYNLSTDWNTGEKKTLASMRYFGNWAEEGHPEVDEVDLGFTIKKETIKDAWDNITHAPGSGYDKWTHINFAPCYNGLNDKMTNDKAVLNFNEIDTAVTPATKTIDTRTYYAQIYHGSAVRRTYDWSLATLPEEMTEWEVKDLRSWAQRPVISSKSILHAICTKCNNRGKYDEGYDVELDEDFFNMDNPYYYDSWMTLPMLTSLEYNTEDGSTVTASTAWSSYYKVGDSNYTYVVTLPSATTTFGTTMKAKFNVYVNAGSASSSKLYPVFDIAYSGGQVKVRNALGIQAFASDGADNGSNVLASSQVAWLGHSVTTVYQGRGYYTMVSPTYKESVKNKTYSAPGDVSEVVEYTGEYEYVGNGLYKWSTPIELSFDLPVGSTCFKINLQFAGTWNGKASTGNALCSSYLVSGSRQNWVYATFSTSSNALPFVNRTWTYDYPSQNNFYSFRQITKEQLLSTDFTPADWLMAYCKMFGLYIWKEPDSNKIHIDTRKTFYHRNDVHNIEDLIDYSKELVISPVAVDSGFYTMKNETDESGAFKDYLNNYGKEYGCKIIDTGYEFDASTKDLIESPLKGAVQVRDNTAYYFCPQTSQGIQPFYYNGFSYALQTIGGSSTETYEFTIPPADIKSNFTAYDSAYPYFDLDDKPQFCEGDKSPVDGSYVMLFFNWFDYDAYKAGYFLSDDLDAMARLNNNPCYIVTQSSADTLGNNIAIFVDSMPRFSRYYAAANEGMVQFSFDWGSVRQLYVPQLYLREENNLYGYFYQSYLEDLYDINTKVLTCYIKPNRTLRPDDMRDFYWFRNSLWRLNKVEGYNVTSNDTVKCEFVKVQDINNMTNRDATTVPQFVTCTITPDKFPASGGTGILELKTNDGFGACVENEDDGIHIQWGGCGRDGKYNVIVSANTGSTARDLQIQLIADNTACYLTVNQAGGSDYLTVTPSAMTFDATGGSQSLTISGTTPWITSRPNWITLSRTSGSGTFYNMATADANPNYTVRTGNIVVTPQDLEPITIPVTQAAAERPWSCEICFTFEPFQIQETGTYDEYSLYWNDTGSSPIDWGYLVGEIQMGTTFYAGDWVDPTSYGYLTDYSINPPFTGNTENNILVPEQYAGSTLYFQVEVGSADLQRYQNSTKVAVNIPQNGGTINVTIPRF